MLYHGMKYIAYKTVGGYEEIIIFPNLMSHDALDVKLGDVMDEIVGAGFIQATLLQGDVYDLRCVGESDSLGVKSRGEVDDKLLRRRLRV